MQLVRYPKNKYSTAIQLHKIGSECSKLHFSLENLTILTDCGATVGKATPTQKVSESDLSVPHQILHSIKGCTLLLRILSSLIQSSVPARNEPISSLAKRCLMS
jgi:hypothetical protein